MSTSEIIENHSDKLETWARAGYVARGLVFLIIGYFAFKAAYSTAETMDSESAVQRVFGAAGSALLWILAVALLGFAFWRVIQAVRDVDGHGSDAKGMFVRAGLLGSAASYGLLALSSSGLAIGTLLSSGGSGSGGPVGWAYDKGFGVWLTYLIAAVFAGVGAAHLVKGAKAGFEKYMNIPDQVRSWLKPVCQFGLIARGITFFVIAALLVRGAASHREGDTPGIEAALDAIGSWSFGWLLLSVTGLGLIAFGIYAFAEARYRRVHFARG